MRQRIQGLLLRNGAAFTLLEVLVAVAALAVLAVGVAAIFDTTGKTVTAGRRVSNFSAAAALIEQQLRQDINSMTREGFLVIRNQYASDGDPVSPVVYPVPLVEGAPGARNRRIDELLFFAKGNFRSARSLFDPDFVAESDTARIYYGHGRRMLRDPANTEYLRPSVVYTFENEANTFLGNPFPDNPNAFAADWILLRHVTLLIPPKTTTTTITGLPPSITPGDAADSDIQIALQPAASSVFRALNTTFPLTVPNRVRSSENRPAFANGLVDVATTSLAEIRSIVATSDVMPSSAGSNFFNPANNQGADGTNAGPDGLARIAGPAPDGDPIIVQRMQAWMDDAFPAYSMGSGTQQTRIRCEFAAPDYVGVSPSLSSLNSPELDYRRADQVMLTAHNFLPRCTEFIVEWSRGETFTSDPSDANYIAARAGEVVWYGMERAVNGEYVALPYSIRSLGAQTAPWDAPIRVPYKRHVSLHRGVWQNAITYLRGQGVEFNGAQWVCVAATSSIGNQPGSGNQWVPVDAARDLPQDASLIHEPFDITVFGDPITSYFGWNDPTFDPEHPNNALLGPNGAGINGILDEPDEAASDTLEWPWPKMIRITLSLADPADPSVEQTFQFVFDVPAAHEGR